MATLLAALNDSLATRPVLEAALGLGRLIGADVEAIHVGEEVGITATNLAEAAAVPLTRTGGPIAPSILRALDAPDVVALSVGCRHSELGRRPAGHITLEILASATKPVMVVPPQAVRNWTHPLRRVLVPVDGSSESSEAFGAFLESFVNGADLDVTALHVVNESATPAFLNHPHRDIDAWRRAFRERHCPTAQRVEWREGNAAEEIVELCRSVEPDLIVVSFAGFLHEHRGEVVRELLSRAPSPILVMPVRRSAQLDPPKRIAALGSVRSRP